jgi:tetratricopeptide (TPR) repeat protein
MIQDTLAKGIMSNDFEESLEFIQSIDYKYPSLTNTTVPINAIIGRYYYKKDSTDLAIKLIKDGMKSNPYIMFSEAQLADIYDQEREYDSFRKYASRAFKKLPNNPVHFVMYARKLISEEKKDSVIYYFDKIRNDAATADYQIWKIVLGSLIGDIDSTLIDDRKRLLDEYRNADIQNEETEILANYVEYGTAQVKAANQFHDNALKLFNQGEFESAIEIINYSIEIYPSKKFYENLIKAYFSLDDFENVIANYEKYSSKFSLTNSLTTSYFALSLFRMNRISEACTIVKHIQTYTNISFPIELESMCM